MIHEARRWHSRAAKINDSLIPDRFGHEYCVTRMKTTLDTLLGKALFVKGTYLFHLVPIIAHLGYTPRVIVSYRPFAEHARSRHRKNGKTVAALLAEYMDHYTTAALQLQIFGGGVVSYSELVDPGETTWATMLAELTGLEARRILDARAERVTEPPRKPVTFDLPVTEPGLEKLHTTFTSLSGQIIEPV